LSELDVAVITPRSRGARRVFEYLRAGAPSAGYRVHLIRPELAKVTRLDRYDVVIAGDHALAAQLPLSADVVVVHDLGPHRSPHLFRGLYLPADADREDLERELTRAEVITFSGTTAQLLERVAGVTAEVIKPGVDVHYWRSLASDGETEGPVADVGALVPSTDPVTKGLAFVAEVKRSGLKTLVVTDKMRLGDWTHIHVMNAADVVVFEPKDRELASMRVKAWVAPGFEGFGLTPLEVAAARPSTAPVWTYDPELGPDPVKPREFQVPRSPEGVESLRSIIKEGREFPIEDYTAEAFAERMLEALVGMG